MTSPRTTALSAEIHGPAHDDQIPVHLGADEDFSADETRIASDGVLQEQVPPRGQHVTLHLFAHRDIPPAAMRSPETGLLIWRELPMV